MKYPALILFFTFFLPNVLSADSVKQLTIDDVLQKQRIIAIKQGRSANRLIHETSPYLLQHAYNPVNWYAWGDAAFEKAKKENKPIFLSIGYSTCHWCHVMAHESFENKEIAAYLNKNFICIKVDREQRPDIDSVYMAATNLINGHGGWPMSVFLDNELRPFHAATYYPPFTIESRTGLNEILEKIHTLWKSKPELIEQVALSVSKKIKVLADDTSKASVLSDNINKLAMRQIFSSFNEDTGGFSVAPKFPRPGIFSYLNMQLVSRGDDALSANIMMTATMDGMLAGGIYDQVAGGFHRYSVDEHWQVPHFEKMLYNQALNVIAYSDLYTATPKKTYKEVVYETLHFVQQEMMSDDTGFYSALDADSERPDVSGEHAEGAYYLWRQSELVKLLTKAEFKFIQKYYDIRESGNIFSDPFNEFKGLNILYIDEEYKGQLITKQQKSWLSSAKVKLNEQRLKRPRPHLDDKIITAWNAMMLSAFANASRVFDDKNFLATAIQSLKFIKLHLYDKKSKKLFRQYRYGVDVNLSRVDATLSDYVWLVNGLIKVYEADENVKWLSWAIELNSKQDELFLDGNTGAYFESAEANLLFRSKSIFDGALPSDNAIAQSNLRKLSEYAPTTVQQDFYNVKANRLVSSFAAAINQNPAAASMLLAVELPVVK